MPFGCNKNVKVVFHINKFHTNFIWNFKITLNKLVFSLTLSISLVSSLSCSLHLRPRLSPAHSPSQTASLSRWLSISGRSIVTVTGEFQNPNPIIAGTDLVFIIFILGLFNWTCLLDRRINCLGRRWPRGCRKAGSIPNPQWSHRIIYVGPCVTGRTFGVPQMALRRSRGRGWIELANRGSVESVARPNHHCLLHRHHRHSRLRSPQVQSWFRFFFFYYYFFHYKFERYASNMIWIFGCVTAVFFFFFFWSWICVVGFGLTWMILFLAREKKKKSISMFIRKSISLLFFF